MYKIEFLFNLKVRNKVKKRSLISNRIQTNKGTIINSELPLDTKPKDKLLFTVS